MTMDLYIYLWSQKQMILRTLNSFINKQNASVQQAVWRQSGCMLAEGLVGI